jgi:hypothetical protein
VKTVSAGLAQHLAGEVTIQKAPQPIVANLPEGYRIETGGPIEESAPRPTQRSPRSSRSWYAAVAAFADVEGDDPQPPRA